MRLSRSILIISTITAAGGAAFAQPDTSAPPPPPPQTEPQPAPEAAAPAAEPPPVVAPAPVVVPAPAPTYAGSRADVAPTSPQRRWAPTSGFGVGLFVGGGVTDFTEGGARAQTNTGGSWTGRVTLGTRSIVGFEGSYIGGAYTIHGLGGNDTLIRNGLEGAVRVNFPLFAQSTLLEPYVVAGMGWNGYHVSNPATSFTASAALETDNTLAVPLGAGFAVGYHGLLVDLRYTIRPTYDQSILANQANTALTNWDLGGMVGYEF
jgi:hypothetical protein